MARVARSHDGVPTDQAVYREAVLCLASDEVLRYELGQGLLRLVWGVAEQVGDEPDAETPVLEQTEYSERSLPWRGKSLI